MHMKFLPQEIEVWYLLPALRRALAFEMARRGMKGVEIAELLGITKSAVSQYFSKARAVAVTFDAEMKKEIQASASRIIGGEDGATEMQRLIMLLKENKGICTFHHKMENVEASCDICFQH